MVIGLENYFYRTIKSEYAKKFDLFVYMDEEDRQLTNLQTLEEFIARLHEKEIIDGQIREVLYDLISCIDEESNNNTPIAYKVVLGNTNSSHRIQRPRISSDCIVHCRCGSVYDENSLVQCYACQVIIPIENVSLIYIELFFYSYGNILRASRSPITVDHIIVLNVNQFASKMLLFA